MGYSDKSKTSIRHNGNLKGGDIVNNVSKPEPVILKPLQVTVGNNFDRAFKAFRAIVQKERVLSTYKEKQHYEKPSVKKRRKQNEARRSRIEQEKEKYEKQ